MDEHYGERRLALAAPMCGLPVSLDFSRDSGDSVKGWVLLAFPTALKVATHVYSATRVWKLPSSLVRCYD